MFPHHIWFSSKCQCLETNISYLLTGNLTLKMSARILPLLEARGPLIFRQLFEKTSSTFTYLIGDAASKMAVLIDPVIETVERDTKLVSSPSLF